MCRMFAEETSARVYISSFRFHYHYYWHKNLIISTFLHGSQFNQIRSATVTKVISARARSMIRATAVSRKVNLIKMTWWEDTLITWRERRRNYKVNAPSAHFESFHRAIDPWFYRVRARFRKYAEKFPRPRIWTRLFLPVIRYDSQKIRA